MTEMFVYMTAADKSEATEIGRTLIHERLAACVNILDNMVSLYWWEGSVQQGSEAVLIAKTTSELVEPLVERVKQLHSYQCPCVVALPIQAGNADYLAWIRSETRTMGPEEEPPMNADKRR